MLFQIIRRNSSIKQQNYRKDKCVVNLLNINQLMSPFDDNNNNKT